MTNDLPAENLWAALCIGEVEPGRWVEYHRGELHVGGLTKGGIARDLEERGLAVLSQKRISIEEGFSYLIARLATPGPARVHAPPLDAQELETEERRTSFVTDRAARDERIIALYDKGTALADIVSMCGLSSTSHIYNALRRAGREPTRMAHAVEEMEG